MPESVQRRAQLVTAPCRIVEALFCPGSPHKHVGYERLRSAPSGLMFLYQTQHEDVRDHKCLLPLGAESRKTEERGYREA